MTYHDIVVIQRLIDVVWNSGETDRIAEFIHPNYAVESTRVGPSWVAENVSSYRQAFPDLNVTIEEIIVNQAHVAALLHLRGRHRGMWKGIPATARSVDYREAAFWTLQDGKIIAGQFVA